MVATEPRRRAQQRAQVEETGVVMLALHCGERRDHRGDAQLTRDILGRHAGAEDRRPLGQVGRPDEDDVAAVVAPAALGSGPGEGVEVVARPTEIGVARQAGLLDGQGVAVGREREGPVGRVQVDGGRAGQQDCPLDPEAAGVLREVRPADGRDEALQDCGCECRAEGRGQDVGLVEQEQEALGPGHAAEVQEEARADQQVLMGGEKGLGSLQVTAILTRPETAAEVRAGPAEEVLGVDRRPPAAREPARPDRAGRSRREGGGGGGGRRA